MERAAFQELCSRLGADVMLANPGETQALEGLRAGLEALIAAGTELSLEPELLGGLRTAARQLAEASAGGPSAAEEACEELGRQLDRVQQAVASARPVASSPPAAPDAPAEHAQSAPAPECEGDILAHFSTHHLEELSRMEELVVTLEQGADPERERELKGMLHTLKGDAGLVGLAEIAQRCHQLEDRLDEGQAGDSADVLLGAIDDFRRIICQRGAAGSRAEPVSVAEDTRASAGDFRAGTIRVESARLDILVERIGELVIAESMVSHAPSLRTLVDPGLHARMNQLDKITRELQSMAMALRMLPIRATFQRMTRLARDVARKLGKEIEFTTTGSETELDKTLVDAIADPLVHLVRNAVDHGIESDPKARELQGKPRAGRITLSAVQHAGSLQIELTDDGRGLDEDSILAKARERGLIAPGASPGRDEILALIFEPGFSTARTVTDVSGRGIGLDVVQRMMRALRGKVEVSSQPGRGTTFTLSLPLTLAIIDGMVVRAAGERFIIPTHAILRMQRHVRSATSSVLGRGTLLPCNGRLAPLHSLAELLDRPAQGSEPSGQIVVVELGSDLVALGVDEILGQQQIVVKPLTRTLGENAGLSGAAVLPDGGVGLILDIGGLMRSVARTSESRDADICRELEHQGSSR